MKLTEDDIEETRVGELGNAYQPIVALLCDNPIEAKELKQQILDDYEKARKWEDYEKGLPVAFALDINDNMVLSPALQKITRQNQKLRELIEKKIVNLPEQIKGAPSQSWIDDYELLLIEFKSLLEDSKK